MRKVDCSQLNTAELVAFVVVPSPSQVASGNLRIGHVPESVVFVDVHKAALVSAGLQASSIATVGVRLIPILNHGLGERINNLSDETVGVGIHCDVVGVVVNRRRARQQIGGGTEAEIVGVGECGVADRIQILTNRGHLVGDATLRIVDVLEYATVRLVFLDNQVGGIQVGDAVGHLVQKCW